MPVKIRLQRQGRKFQSIYSIVVADSRAPRDGKYIESLGQYNPNTNPATIILDFNRALEWLQKGAQPTDTCRAILSYKGVLYKKHLLEGVKKGAFDEAEAEKRFQSWMTEKEQKIQAKRDRIKSTSTSLTRSRLEEETKIKEARAAELVKKRSVLLEAERKEAAAGSEEAETPEETPAAAEAPAEEAPAAAEAPAEEAPAAAEAPAEVAEEAAAGEVPAEAKASAEVAEEAAEETPAEEAVAEKKEEKNEEEAPAGEAAAEEKAEASPAEETPSEEPAAEADAEEKAEEAPAAEKAEEPEKKEDSAGEEKESGKKKEE